MSSTRKFMFDRSFDEPGAQEMAAAAAAAEAALPPPPPPPSFPQEVVDNAREQGYALGMAAAQSAMLNGIERQQADAIDRLCRDASLLLDQWRDASEQRMGETVKLAMAIAAKLFPALARREALGEIETMISDCIAELRDEPRVVLRLPEALLDRVKERLDGLARAQGFEGRFVLLTDPALAPTDARMEWADGGAERSYARLWQDLERAAARIAPQTTAPAGAPTLPGTLTPAAAFRPDASAANIAPSGPTLYEGS